MQRYPDPIGGRDIDLEQIHHSLYREVRDAFPINEVPTEVLVKLGDLKTKLEAGSTAIKSTIDTIRRFNKDFMRD